MLQGDIGLIKGIVIRNSVTICNLHFFATLVKVDDLYIGNFLSLGGGRNGIGLNLQLIEKARHLCQSREVGVWYFVI